MPIRLRSARTAVVVVAALAAACATRRVEIAAAPAATPTSPERVRLLLGALAHDSMEGRGTGTRGSMRAARFIAERMREAGLEPAGDSGFLQRIPMAMVERRRQLPNRQEQVTTRPVAFPSFAALDTVPASRRVTGVNVVGALPGSDPALASEVVLVDAHYDHVGIRAPVNGDSIYNGADDDASGVVAVLEIARQLAAGPRPKRTVVFLATTGEEVGLVGTNWYIAHPVRPLERHVANLEFEMIARPDSLAGGAGRGWLTGYERSTMGDVFSQAGLPIGPDKRPEQNFFMRSDNIAFARRGIIAHVISSFNLHKEYHTPDDEVELADFDHMSALINASARAARLIADGPTLEWKPGGRPEAPRRP